MSDKPLITFVTPPSIFLMDERVYPALGILKVAAVAERLGYPVAHLDLNGCENYEEVVSKYAADSDCSVYAMTATTPQMVAATKIRKCLQGKRIIIGGPHPTLVHAAYRMGSQRAIMSMNRLLEDYDVVVAGDGENAIEHAINMEDGGLIDADDPKTSLFLSSKQLGELPFPARHLIDLGSYHYEIDGVRVTPLVSQLGCPFGCNFCAGRDSAMLRRVRLRSTESVLAEMEHIYRTYGIHGWMDFSDELNVNRQFVELLKGMCDLQNRLGVEFRCRGFVKSELFTEEQAEWMYQAGFRRIMCGFESGSDRILKNIKKNATKDDNTKAMEISHKYSLDMKALMSIGHPGESPETVQDTIDWLIAVNPADMDATIITAYPGSPYYDRAINNGYDATWSFEVNGDWLHMEDIDYTEVEDFYKGSLDGYKSYVWTDYMDAEEMVRMRGFVEKHVRGVLKIPFYTANAAKRFESSMGMLPSSIYRSSN